MGWHGGNDDRYRRVYVASQSEVGGVLGIYRHLDPRYTRLSWNGEIRVGSEPVSIAVDSATHRVYVASAGAKLVSVILQGPG
jgi:DNA-binding beta-propeller fold protein YncE